jgi:hypothetical protein
MAAPGGLPTFINVANDKVAPDSDRSRVSQRAARFDIIAAIGRPAKHWSRATRRSTSDKKIDFPLAATRLHATL